MQSLPAPVKRRIKALKQLQLVTTNIEAKFYEEVHALECEYYKMCAPLYHKRSEIISGAYEPTDEQCVWDSDEDEEALSNLMKEKVKIENTTEKEDEYVFVTIYQNCHNNNVFPIYIFIGKKYKRNLIQACVM